MTNLSPQPKLSKDDTQLSAGLAIWRCRGVGARSFARLEKYFHELSHVFQPGVEYSTLASLGLSNTAIAQLKNPDWGGVERDLEWSEQIGCKIIPIWSDRYPKQLREVTDAPPILYAEGDLSLLNNRQIAIVGTRKPTHSGRELASAFARHLSERGFVITSGLAIGIDGASHLGVLEATGRTIAVLGSGLDQIYPKSHRGLARDIVNRGGLMLSEFPLGVQPIAKHFPRRNRIISGLSEGVLVVEAAEKSGSLITANYAVEQNREVFAVPGSIHNPVARGCHQLIKQGAKLVDSIQDIIEEILPAQNMDQAASGDLQQVYGLSVGSFSAAEKRVFSAIGHEITTVDMLVARTGYSSSLISSICMALTLQGMVEAVVGGYIKKVSNS